MGAGRSAGNNRLHVSAPGVSFAHRGDTRMHGRIDFTSHAIEEARDEGLSRADIRLMVQTGEIIEDERREGRALPTRLLLSMSRGSPYHVAVGYDDATGYVRVVTVYAPDPARWSSDFRRRVSR